MPKLKRDDSEARATDFVESLDRGLRLLQTFGTTTGPMTLSDLAREGIANSGSFRFADHIYAGLASGRTPLGRFLDRRLLATPAACAFRRRYQRAQSAIRHALESTPLENGQRPPNR